MLAPSLIFSLSILDVSSGGRSLHSISACVSSSGHETVSGGGDVDSFSIVGEVSRCKVENLLGTITDVGATNASADGAHSVVDRRRRMRRGRNQGHMKDA
jgi:hypothetical protein